MPLQPHAGGRSGTVGRLRLRARGATGAVAHDRVAVLAERLSARTAPAVTRNLEWFGDPAFGRCRRFSARRVDCVSFSAPDGSCYAVYAIEVESSGLVGFRPYDCDPGRPFRRHPRWFFDAVNLRIPYPPFHRPGTAPAPLP